MLFGDTALAQRIEAAGLRSLASMIAGARLYEPTRDLFIEQVSGGQATYFGANSPFNCLAGLGFEAPVDIAALAGIEDKFRESQAPLKVELSSMAKFDCLGPLGERGYKLSRIDHVYAQLLPSNTSPSRATTGLRIERVAANLERGDRWLTMMATGFAHGGDGGPEPTPECIEADAQTLVDGTRASGMRLYAAWLDGKLAGGANLRIDEEGIAQFHGAATLPGFRRRGVQSALLHARLADAAEAGCELAVVATGPGSASARNLRAYGFGIVGTNVFLTRGWG